MQERDSLRSALVTPLPGSDGQPDSVGARLTAAQAASRLAQAEAQVLQLSHTLQTTQVGCLLACGCALYSTAIQDP